MGSDAIDSGWPGAGGKVTANVGSSSSGPAAGSFDLRIEPHLLVPVPPSRGPITLNGRFDTGRKTGSLQLAAPGVPAELAAPWLTLAAGEHALLPGWSLDVDANLGLGEESAGLTGTGQLRLARQEGTWATAEVEILSATTSGGVAARMDGLLLPDRPGRRSIRAAVEAPEWAEIKQLTLSDGQIEIVGTDLAGLREDVASVWPDSLPESVERSMVGMLEADVMAAGSIEHLQLDVEATWNHGDTDKVELRAAASAERLILESVSGQIGERRFSGSAQVDLPVPIERAEARFELVQLLPEVPKMGLSVRLDGGVANIEAHPETLNGVTPTLTAEVPLASLGDLPEVGEALAALPIVRADGPLRLAGRFPKRSGPIGYLDSMRNCHCPVCVWDRGVLCSSIYRSHWQAAATWSSILSKSALES